MSNDKRMNIYFIGNIVIMTVIEIVGIAGERILGQGEGQETVQDRGHALVLEMRRGNSLLQSGP